jgi:hypothetical protein
MKTLKYFACVAALAVCGSVSAATFTFEFNGMTSGTGTSVQVDAQAIFNVTAGHLQITLNNLQVIYNNYSAGANISDLSFTLSNVTSGGSLDSSSGLERTVAADGSFTDGSTVATGWTYSVSLGTFLLEGLGQKGAIHTIIGQPNSGDYSLANASIKGSVHNPYLFGPVTFDISNAGITADTTVTGAIFSFGTDVGEGSGTGKCTSGCGENAPDGGTTSLLLGFALAGLGVMRRYLKF